MIRLTSRRQVFPPQILPVSLHNCTRVLLWLAMVLFLLPTATEPAQAAPLSEAEINKRKIAIHRTLLNIYLAKHQKADTLKEFAIMTKLKPGDSALHYEYGRYLAQVGNYSAARAPLLKAAKLDPTKAEIEGTLGTVSIKLKDFNAALAHFRKAVSLGGDYKKQYEDTAKYVASIERRKVYEAKQSAYRKKLEARQKALAAQEDDDNDW